MAQPWIHQKSIKNLSKIIEKSSKNPSKIYQNPSKINQKTIKIGSWVPRGPKTPPSPKTGGKSSPLSLPPRNPFGRLFWPCWPPRATKRPFKKHTKFSLILKSIFHGFFIDFGRVLAGSWTQVGFKNPLKI